MSALFTQRSILYLYQWKIQIFHHKHKYNIEAIYDNDLTENFFSFHIENCGKLLLSSYYIMYLISCLFTKP